MNLQEAAGREQGLEGAELLHYSRYYRSALHECVMGLKKKAEGKTHPSTTTVTVCQPVLFP